DAVGDQLRLHIASTTRSASTLHRRSGASSTYATRGPGRTSGARSLPSQRLRPPSSACSARTSAHGSASSPPSARACRSTAARSRRTLARREHRAAAVAGGAGREPRVVELAPAVGARGDRPGGFGARMQPEREALDRAEPALRAAVELPEVVAGDVLDDLPAR